MSETGTFLSDIGRLHNSHKQLIKSNLVIQFEIMKTTFNVLFFLKRDKQKKNGNVPLMCRITVDGNETRFSMKTDIDLGLWDVKLGKMT